MRRNKKKKYKPWKDLWGGYSYDWGASFRKDDSAVAHPGYLDYTPSYYYEPPLSAKYVEQLVLGIGNQYGITVIAGDRWGIDLKKKTLEFDPKSLQYSTKAEVLASILHECGHIRHTTPYQDLRSTAYYPKYSTAKIVINSFEDFRVDELMAHAYDGADDIYALNQEAMQREADNFDAQSAAMRSAMQRIIEQVEDKKKRAALLEKLNKITLYDYLSAILRKGSGIAIKWLKPEVRLRLEKTEGAIEKCRFAKSTDDVNAILEREVFPYIEDLLKEADEDEKNGSGAGKGNGADGTDGDGTVMVRTFGIGNKRIGKVEDIPPDWPKLADMVRAETKELIAALRRITVKDEALRFEAQKRHGKVYAKRLYRARLNDTRLFKKKIMQEVKTRELAFSLVVDRSGSMKYHDNDRLGNTFHRGTQAGKVTAMVALASEALNIPYEIIAFDSIQHYVKRFADIFNTKRKDYAYRAIVKPNGDNAVERAIQDASELARHPKRRRVMFIVTDGGESNPIQTARWIKNYQAKTGVRVVFLGIGEQDERYQYIKEPYGKMFIGNTNEMPAWIGGIVKRIAGGTL